MAHWLLALALATAHGGYATAYRRAEEGGMPLVILIGADWCGACNAMQATMGKVDPKLREQIAYTYVDADTDAKLARSLSGDGPLPQLIAFWQTKNGWVRSLSIGSHNVKDTEKTLQGWIDRAVDAAEEIP
jgi:thioredoxin-like negative regulator of GroEL